MPHEVAESYAEFKFTEHFGLAVGYDDMPAHKVDWWTQFIKVDREVERELQERAKG